MKIGSTALYLCWVLYCLVANSTHSQAQVYLQIEKFNSPKTVKLIPGTPLEFRLHAYPKTWRKGTIEYILYDEQTIALDGDIFHVDELKDIRFTRPWAKQISRSLVTFSGAWFTYGLLITAFDDNFEFGVDTVAIGGSAFVLGILIKKIFGKKKYKLGKNSRLRVVDLRF
jgi:hypothetical protein